MQESIAERLQWEYANLNRILEDESLTTLALACNYDHRKLKDMLHLWKRVDTLVEKHRRLYPGQFAATDSDNELFIKTREVYLRLAQAGQILFKYHPSILSGLGLLGRRKLTYTGFVFQADQFYGTALASENILQSYQDISYAESKILAGHHLYHKLKRQVQQLDSENGAAREMTYQRDQLLDQLEDQFYDLLGYLQIEARNDPALLKTIRQMKPQTHANSWRSS